MNVKVALSIADKELKKPKSRSRRAALNEVSRMVGELSIPIGKHCLTSCEHLSRDCVRIAIKEMCKSVVHGECEEASWGAKSYDTLCWCCKYSVGKCSWSSHGEPIDGWTVIENKNGLQVKACPKFKRG